MIPELPPGKEVEESEAEQKNNYSGRKGKREERRSVFELERGRGEERKDAAKTFSVKHTGRKKLLAAGGETNTAEFRNKYNTVLGVHGHTHAHSAPSCRKVQHATVHSLRRAKGSKNKNSAHACVLATAHKQGLPVNVGGWKLR